MSHADAFATGIKIFNRQKLSLIAWSFTSKDLDHLTYRGSKGKDMEFQSEQGCVPGIKNILCWRRANTLCYGAKVWNVILRMLKHHAENIAKQLAQNMDIHAKTSCSKYRHYAQMLVYTSRNIHTCSNSKHVIIITTGQYTISDQLFCLSDYFSEICNQIWLEIHYFSILSGYMSWLMSTAYWYNRN